MPDRKREQPIDREYLTADGYTLAWVGNAWTDGDHTFSGDYTGPVTDDGHEIEGRILTPYGRITYQNLSEGLEDVLKDFQILSGAIIGESGESWQQRAKLAAEHIDDLHRMMRAVSLGQHESFMAFPSPKEALERVMGDAHE